LDHPHIIAGQLVAQIIDTTLLCLFERLIISIENIDQKDGFVYFTVYFQKLELINREGFDDDFFGFPEQDQQNREEE